MLTLAQIASIFCCPPDLAGSYSPHLALAMDEFQITGTDHQAMFLGLVSAFSQGLQVVHRAPDATGDGNGAMAAGLAAEAGKFCGRGLLPIQGARLYLACSVDLFGDVRLLSRPGLLERPSAAARSAAWFWTSSGFPLLAETNSATACKAIARLIMEGEPPADCVHLWQLASRVLRERVGGEGESASTGVATRLQSMAF